MKNKRKKHAKYRSPNRQYLYSAHISHTRYRTRVRLPKKCITRCSKEIPSSPDIHIQRAQTETVPIPRISDAHIELCISSMMTGDNEMRDRSIPTSTNSMLEMQKHYSRATSTNLNASANVPHSLAFALGPSEIL